MNTKIINTHPQLVPMPTNIWDRVNLMRRHSILHGEAVRERLMLKALESVPAAERLAKLHTFFRPKYDLKECDFERDMAWFRQALPIAHAAHQHLLKDFIPLLDRKNLEMISDVGTECDPLELILYTARATQAASEHPDDVVTCRAADEGHRQLRLTQLEFEAMLYGLSKADLSIAMSRFVSALEGGGFFAEGRSERLFFEADHDPANKHRVKGQPTIRHNGNPRRSIPEGLVRNEQPLDVRFIKTPRGNVRVFFDPRIKEYLSLKLIRDCEVDPRALHDLLGAKFVFFSTADLRAGVRALRETLVRIPGMVFGQASNLQRAGVANAENGSSANEYRVLKFNVHLFGQYFELQFMLIEDWLNEWASYGEENHEFYKIRAYRTELFPFIWPRVRYRIDWNDKDLVQRMLRMVHSRIGWI